MKSEHILEGQAELCAALASVCKFKGYTLYFPRSGGEAGPQLLPRERKLLLPLIWHKELLGVLVLQNIVSRQIRPILPALPAIIELTLEKMALARELATDPVTGLLREQSLYAWMEEECAIAKAPDNLGKDLAAVPAYKLCMGLILLRIFNGEEIVMRCGARFTDSLLAECADALRSQCGSGCLVRSDRYEFGFLFQATGREKCRQKAETLLAAVNALSFVNPLTRQSVHPLFGAGFAYYPHDMRGYELQFPIYEQATILRRRVSLACDVASTGRCVAYTEIVKKGGRITQVYPLGRFRINLGRRMGVRNGMRFAVFGMGDERACKGDLSKSGNAMPLPRSATWKSQESCLRPAIPCFI